MIRKGPWERAGDVAPILKLTEISRQPVLVYAMRRRVYEYWYENGEKFGRWTWEYEV